MDTIGLRSYLVQWTSHNSDNLKTEIGMIVIVSHVTNKVCFVMNSGKSDMKFISVMQFLLYVKLPCPCAKSAA